LEKNVNTFKKNFSGVLQRAVGTAAEGRKPLGKVEVDGEKKTK